VPPRAPPPASPARPPAPAAATRPAITPREASRTGETRLAPEWTVPVVAVIAHLPSLRNGYTTDDFTLLVDNPYVRSVAGLRPLLTWELFQASATPVSVPFFRPVSGLVNWLSYQLLGGSAPLQHALNLVLFAALALALVRALRGVRLAPPVATGAAMIVVTHPLTSGSVAYVQGRQDLLSMTLVLAAVAVVRRLRAPAAALVTYTATLTAALTKELWLLGAVLIPLATLEPSARSWRHGLVRTLAAFGAGGLAMASVGALRAALAILPATFVAAPLGDRLAAHLAAGARLGWCVLVPVDIAHVVSVERPGPTAALALTAAALVAAGIAGGVWLRRRPADAPSLLFGFALAAGASVAAGELLLRFQTVSDRYGLSLLVAGAFTGGPLVSSLAASLSPRLASLARHLPLAVALALLPLTWAQDGAYRDDDALLEHQIAVRPEDPESWASEAQLLMRRGGDPSRVFRLCREVERRKPGNDRVRVCVAASYLAEGNPEAALPYLRRAAEGAPGDATHRSLLLQVLLTTHREAEARSWLARWEPVFGRTAEIAAARARLEAAPAGSAAPPDAP